MANKMLIDATHPEETRVVVLRGNRVEEFDFETAHRKQLRGNIYLAKVTRVEPSLQAAFVDYGGNRHGFLAFSEIHPDYYQIPVADRQALIDDDARAARDFDDEDENRRGGGGGGGNKGRRGGRSRHREARRSERPDDAVRSDAVGSEHGSDSAEDLQRSGTGDATADLPSGEHPSTPTHEFEAQPQAYPETPPIGETENPPVPAEIAAADPVHPETGAGAQETEHRSEHGYGQAEADQTSHSPSEAHDGEQPASDGDSDRSYGQTSFQEAGSQDNGHGADEEEEIVDTVGGADAMEEVLDRAPRHRRQYKIQEVIKRRQVMLVQVVKEERGTKGAALTTYLSLAGRYSVLMPNTARGGGISRKITSTEDRKKLREIADELEVPEGMGVILRTAGAARTKAEVKRDFEYLLRLWETVRDLTLKSTAPTLVYEEGSLAKRSIRDLYSKDIEEIVVAGEEGYKDAKDFMRMLMPSHAKNVKLYKDTQPVFARYGIESQLDAMFSPTVQLRSGGYIVINQTEALVAIDVNSGRSTREHHIEDTALKTNVEAAEEVARQLRLRDLAGLIVIDFIDMDEKRNNRTVERRMKDALRNDRARIQVGRISHFGLLEMSRQRIRTSVLESSTEKCAHCGGTGHMRSVSSVALQLLRALEESLQKGATHNQIVRTRPEIALYVLNHKRAHLQALEQRYRITITVNADENIEGQISFAIDRGEQVMTLEQAKALAAQNSAAMPVLEEEPEDAAIEADFEEEAAEGDKTQTQSSEEDVPEESDGAPRQEGSERDSGERDGRGRRRRRRGRGRGEGREEGRGGEGREHAPAERGPFAQDAGGAHSDAQPDYSQPSHDGLPADSGLAPPAGNGGPPRDAEGANGNGELRRRRRGRRGGRRNRRDRDDPNFQQGIGPGHDRSQELPHESQPQGQQPDWSQDQPQPPAHDIASDTYAPRIERPAPQPVAMEPAVPTPPAPSAPPPAAAAEAPRRRSTVREPAPVFSESAPVPVPIPVAQPEPPAAVVSSPSAPDDANKPRRTGWWAKRLMGGSDKN